MRLDVVSINIDQNVVHLNHPARFSRPLGSEPCHVDAVVPLFLKPDAHASFHLPATVRDGQVVIQALPYCM